MSLLSFFSHLTRNPGDRLRIGRFRQEERLPKIRRGGWGVFCSGLLLAQVINGGGDVLEPPSGVPNGTWLSQPQIRYYASANALEQVMEEIREQNYKVVFLDFRGVPDEVQKRVSQKARERKLIPVVWVQSPQYRSLSVEEMIYEARNGDGIQVDDHFFAHYSAEQFQALRDRYNNPIFCSIQPFQANLVPSGCNQLDVQCYAGPSFQSCMSLADKLKAVVSLSDKDTVKFRQKLGVRAFNIFLWPHSP